MPLEQSNRYKLHQPVVETDEFIVGFPLFGVDDLTVYVDGVLNELFSVVATFTNGRSDDAVIQLVTAVSGVDVEIYGTRIPRRDDDYIDNSPALAQRLQEDADRLTAVQQEQARDYQSAIRVAPNAPVVAPLSGSNDDRADRVIAFNETGFGLTLGPKIDEIAAAQGYAEDAGNSAIEAGEARDEAVNAVNSLPVNFKARGGVSNSAAAASANSELLEAIKEEWLAAATQGNLTIYLSAGRWWFSEEHDVSSSATWRNMKLKGDGRHLTSMETTLSGADKVFIDAGDDRNNAFEIEGITLVTRNADATVCPVLFKDLNMTEGALTDVGFVQGSNGQIGGTLTLTSGHWNTDWTDCHSFGGGHYKPANAAITPSTTFALTSGDATVTCSDAVFTSFDIGRKFLFGEIGGSWVGTVASVTSATEVEMTEAAPYTNVAEVGYSEALKATTIASNATVTLSSGQAVESDVGRIVVIRGAGTVRGVRCHHRATVTAVPAPNQITLDRAPTHSVSDATIYFSPAHAVIYDDSDPLENTLNDTHWMNFRVESYHGLGAFIEDAVDFNALNLKLHGKGTKSFGYIPDNMSQAGMLIKSRSGYINQGNVEASGFDTGRIISSGSESLFVTDISGRRDNGQAVIWSEYPESPFSTVMLGDVTLYNEQWGIDDSGRTLEKMLSGPTSTRQTLIHSGETVVSSGYSQRISNGRGTATSPALSALGSEWFYIGNGVQETFPLPATGYQNTSKKAGLVFIWNDRNQSALVSYYDDGAGFRTCKLLLGDTSVLAASNTSGATNSGKITFSIDNTHLYIDNAHGITRFNMMWLS